MERDTQQRTDQVAGVVLECPQCLKSCSLTDEQCPECGFRFRTKSDSSPDRTIHFDPILKKRYTNTVIEEIGLAGASRNRLFWVITNLIVGGVLAAIGALMAYAMPFGFECGMIFVFIGAIFILNVYMTSDGTYKRIDGCCPHCGAVCRVSIGKKETSGTDKCQKCNGLFHYEGERFEESGTL
jgi:hypothetical protein